MTGYNRGDVVLVSFLFSDESGTKRRPALVISSAAYHNGRSEVIIAAITSRTDRLLVGDYLINDWQQAGLLFPSVVAGIFRTVKEEMIAREMGSLSLPDMESVDGNLKLVLGL